MIKSGGNNMEVILLIFLMPIFIMVILGAVVYSIIGLVISIIDTIGEVIIECVKSICDIFKRGR